MTPSASSALETALEKATGLKIGSRGSPLALAQAFELRRSLAAAHGWAETDLTIQAIKTTGDMIQDRALSEAGGKGLFTKELDLALMRGDIDIAVHSSKDLPTFLPDELEILGYLPREDARDAWICKSAKDPQSLGRGGLVGTASLRRAALLKRLRPDLTVTLLRGNVETRLAKVEKGDLDATLLACAGLKRLGLLHRATAILDADLFVPAVGQGAIGITARRGDAAIAAVLSPILDAQTAFCLNAERAFLRVLDGSCRTPIGGHAQLSADGILQLRGIILRPDGSQSFEACLQSPAAEAETLGERVAQDLLQRAPKDFFKD